jgi:hypothetical protein
MADHRDAVWIARVGLGPRPAKPGAEIYLRWPRPIPSFKAFCLKEPSDLFISFAIFGTGVLAFECCLKSLMSDAVYGLRVNLFLFRLITLLSSGARVSRSGGS